MHWVRSISSIIAVGLLAACGETPPPVDAAAHRAEIEAWQAERAERLTGAAGWLSLAGLFWLEEGANSFGRGPEADLRLDNPNLPPLAGIFMLQDGHATFAATPQAIVKHVGEPVATIALHPDTAPEPTVLELGTLSFYLIERGDRLGVRVKDSEVPARLNFKGLEYFPIDARWRVRADFIAYEPPKVIPILDVTGMRSEMTAPGVLVFTIDGREYRLDPVIEEGSDELFIMFADATSAKETYGAGRYLYVTYPENGKVIVDFNKAYNPPCAFSDFATCPLPPMQNRLDLRIPAGEMNYAH